MQEGGSKRPSSSRGKTEHVIEPRRRSDGPWNGPDAVDVDRRMGSDEQRWPRNERLWNSHRASFIQ